jgi:hypothetical protein
MTFFKKAKALPATPDTQNKTAEKQRDPAALRQEKMSKRRMTRGTRPQTTNIF